MKRSDSAETRSLVGQYNVTLFPNPTKGALRVDISGINGDNPATVFITEITGRNMLKTEFTSSENTLDMSSYPNGAYLMTIVIGDKSETWKVVKME